MNRILIPVLLWLFLSPSSEAQELAKIRHDYLVNPTGVYSPDDPWTRSRIWRRHTGHFGKFYNCDCEEQKRYSPYICWKNADCPFVDEGWLFHKQRTRQRIRQRIADGSCACGCQAHHAATNCSCDTCRSGMAQSDPSQPSAQNSSRRVAHADNDTSFR